MKKLTLFTISLLIFQSVWTVSLTTGNEPQTEVIVIGTVHNPTKNYTVGSLKHILERVNPQVVLLEFDSSFFNDSLTALNKGSENITLESRAATWLKHQKGAIIRHYEIEGRNDFYRQHRYFEKERALNASLDSLYKENLLSEESRKLLEALWAFCSVRNKFQQETPFVLNTQAFDTLVEKTHHYMHIGVSRIIDVTPALKAFAGFQGMRTDFWSKRHEAMIDNIISYAKEFSGQRIAVLCGNEHSAYLRPGLRERGIGWLVVRDYWEYE